MRIEMGSYLRRQGASCFVFVKVEMRRSIAADDAEEEEEEEEGKGSLESVRCGEEAEVERAPNDIRYEYSLTN